MVNTSITSVRLASLVQPGLVTDAKQAKRRGYRSSYLQFNRRKLPLHGSASRLCALAAKRASGVTTTTIVAARVTAVVPQASGGNYGLVFAGMQRFATCAPVSA